jgi:FkbM family methyltransferase
MSDLTWAILERIIWWTRGHHFTGRGRVFRACCPTRGQRTVRIGPGVRIRLDLADHLQRLMYMDLLHHDWMPIMPALLHAGSTFVDVGANIGYFSLVAAGLVGPSGRVIAVEPIPRTFQALTSNIALNAVSHIQAERVALGAANGTLTLYLPPLERHQDYLISALPIQGGDAVPVSVPALTLDAACEHWSVGAVDLMKIDVEGHEPDVIRGGRAVLASGRIRALVIELSGVHLAYAQETPHSMVREIEGLGFRLMALDRSRRLVPRTCPPLRTDRDYNLFFVHRSALQDSDVGAAQTSRLAGGAPT